MNSEKEFSKLIEVAYEDLLCEYIAKIESSPDIVISDVENNAIIKFLNSLYMQHTEVDQTENVIVNKKGKKVLKVLLVVAIILLIMACTAFAIRPIRNYIIQRFNDYSEIVFSSTGEDDYLNEIYMYIPDGYYLDVRNKTRNNINTIYTDGKRTISILSTESDNAKFLIDTEEAAENDILIGRYTGYYSETPKGIVLVWSTGKYSHLITTDKDDNLTIETVIKIAESRQKKIF